MSVFKLHQALSVGNRLNAQSITPEKNIFVTKDDLKENTYSPLRDKYPDGEINISIDKLLDYTLKLSDNNACDILFKYISDTKETDNYIRGLGIEDFSISQTEDDMHKDLKTAIKLEHSTGDVKTYGNIVHKRHEHRQLPEYHQRKTIVMPYR